MNHDDLIGYKAVLFAPDGEWVTDYFSPTKDDVWEKVANMGSRWIFYPIVALAKGHERYTLHSDRIVEPPTGFGFGRNWTIAHMAKVLQENPILSEEYLST